MSVSVAVVVRARSASSGRRIQASGVLGVVSMGRVIFLVISRSVGRARGMSVVVGSSSFHFHFLRPVRVEGFVLLVDRALILARMSDLMVVISSCVIVSLCWRARNMVMKA